VLAIGLVLIVLFCAGGQGESNAMSKIETSLLQLARHLSTPRVLFLGQLTIAIGAYLVELVSASTPLQLHLRPCLAPQTSRHHTHHMHCRCLRLCRARRALQTTLLSAHLHIFRSYLPSLLLVVSNQSINQVPFN
jgi:hypothetical protein